MPAVLNAAALLALVPAVLVPLRRGGGRDGVFWLVLLLAVAGPAVWAVAQFGQDWQTGLSANLWVVIAATMVLFAGVVLLSPQAWRLTPLLLPYLLVMGLLASAFRGEAGQPMLGTAPALWLDLHIVVSVLTYALLTIAAVAALAAFLQERALKRKRPDRLTRMLPAVADSEGLSVRLLALSELVLGLGLLTGMATEYFETGRLLAIEHKTLLSLLAFAVIGALLLAHRLTGVRGRAAARLLLLGYLLLTLAYPGVKFVTDVLLA